ncbi:MAG TPA: FAD-dependent oxidoreductase [Acidimicrobiia bacterium]|nr:FAD-dependent oxidoreductase [Acidimicrobiia bacterium]
MAARERLVVIGGDAGGMTAAAMARRRRPQDELEIVAFERTPHTSYSACGIPYLVGGLVDDADDLVARSPEEHRARGIDVRVGHEVVSIDTRRRAVEVVAAGASSTEPYDLLLVATGAVPVRPPLPGIDAVGVHGVQTLADGLALRDEIDTQQPAHAVVVGGGYIGLEVAEALVTRGAHVTVIEAGEQPMSTLDPDIATRVADAMRAIGIDVRLGTPVDAFETGPDGRVRAVVAGDTTVPADVVVLGLGVHPASALARDAGIDVGVTGGIVTDPTMRTSADGVWAAGDCVEVRHRVSGEPMAIALGTYANRQGRVAGITLTGGDATFDGVLGTAVSKICEYEVARTGLREADARRAGFDAVTATIDSTSRASYFPGAQPITVKVIADRRTGRVLGGQIFGREGAATRIDVLAVAIWNGMTADDLAATDLSYAPPFGPVWDPVAVAARKAAELA